MLAAQKDPLLKELLTMRNLDPESSNVRDKIRKSRKVCVFHFYYSIIHHKINLQEVETAIGDVTVQLDEIIQENRQKMKAMMNRTPRSPYGQILSPQSSVESIQRSIKSLYSSAGQQVPYY
jgi:hypothetical protein